MPFCLAARALALVLALIVPTASLAEPAEVRDIEGDVVDLERPGIVMAFWSLSCGTCGADLRALVATGARVVAVSTDPAQLRSRLKPWIRLRGLDLPVIADPTGELRARFGYGTVLIEGPSVAASLEVRSARAAAPSVRRSARGPQDVASSAR